MTRTSRGEATPIILGCMRLLFDRFPISLVLFLLGSFAFSTLPGGRACAADDLLIASSEEHVWLIVRDPTTRGTWRLMHHASGMAGSFARVARTLDAKPMAIAARGDQVLLAVPPHQSSGTVLDLLGLRVQENPTLGTYYDVPLDGWDIFAGVSNKQPLGGISIGAEGPNALLLPSVQRSAGVRRTRGGTVQEPEDAALLRHSAYAWEDVALPDALLKVARQELLPSVGLAEASILAPLGEGTSGLFTLAEGTWSTRELGVPRASIQHVVRYQDRFAYALEEQEGTIRLVFERGGSLLTILEFDTPKGCWGLASVGDSLLILEVDEAGVILARTVDPIVGSLQEPIIWEPPPLDLSDWLHLPIIGMLVVAALLAIVLFRPSEPPDMPLRCGVVPMAFSRRLLALGIDLIPGIVIALLLFDIDPARLSLLNLFSPDIALAGPGSVVIAITIWHETMAELIADRSIGKLICGGVVRASNGGRASRGSILLRCMFKAVVLYAPILAVFVILSPARQGVPETVSRTVVADAHAREEPTTDA